MPDQKLLPVATLLAILNVAAAIFYYSPLTLRGYWPDAVFLLAAALLTLRYARHLRPGPLRVGLRATGWLNVLLVSWTSLSLWHGVLPAHLIPAGRFADRQTYAYFLERGNQGALNGCYGEVQYHRALPWLPLLEVKTETDRCSALDYQYLLECTPVAAHPAR